MSEQDFSKLPHVEFNIDPETGDITSEGKNINGPHCTQILEELKKLIGGEPHTKIKPEGLPQRVQNRIQQKH